MPLLLLIRHGENEYTKKGVLAGRRSGVHLNERGQMQAAELAKALTGAPIRAIYTSPLERAVETAAPIARALHLRANRQAGLTETDVGSWEGRSVRQLARTRYWRIIQKSPSRATHPGGESFAQTQVRIVAALDAICSEHGPRDLIACVLHADPIKLAVAHYLGLPLDNFQRLACETGSVTLIFVAASSAHLVWLNRRPPFELSSLQ